MAAEKLDTTAEGIAKRMREATDIEDATSGEAQRRLAGAIEDLRVKYEKINADKAAKEKEDAKKAAQVEEMAAKAAAKAESAALEGDTGEVEDEGDLDGDDDPELRAIRERRLKQMKRAQEKKRQAKLAGHGQYIEITEDDFLKEVTGSKHVICHFYHNDFEKCKVMDKHLSKLAPLFMETKFIKLNAEKAPFFVTKLSIRTLPTLIRFTDGVADHSKRITGFEGLLGSEDFHTGALAESIGLVEYFDEYYEHSGEPNPREIVESDED